MNKLYLSLFKPTGNQLDYSYPQSMLNPYRIRLTYCSFLVYNSAQYLTMNLAISVPVRDVYVWLILDKRKTFKFYNLLSKPHDLDILL